mmetsp:Transcript_21377/g.52699  ORF Transcript_21377/g.52699 Transcript_21377/m.52699 type:complete len:318 (-) Transcript_21377:653-1606(-)
MDLADLHQLELTLQGQRVAAACNLMPRCIRRPSGEVVHPCVRVEPGLLPCPPQLREAQLAVASPPAARGARIVGRNPVAPPPPMHQHDHQPLVPPALQAQHRRQRQDEDDHGDARVKHRPALLRRVGQGLVLVGQRARRGRTRLGRHGLAAVEGGRGGGGGGGGPPRVGVACANGLALLVVAGEALPEEVGVGVVNAVGEAREAVPVVPRVARARGRPRARLEHVHAPCVALAAADELRLQARHVAVRQHLDRGVDHPRLAREEDVVVAVAPVVATAVAQPHLVQLPRAALILVLEPELRFVHPAPVRARVQLRLRV